LLLSGILAVLLALAAGLTLAQGPGHGGEGAQPSSVARVQAIVGAAIPIQGRLTDASGNPVPDGRYSITASIYNVSSGGTALCSKTQSVHVSNGLFNMTIDNCTSEDINGQQLYLGIKVGTDDEMTPRQPIYPVPYAWSLRPGARIETNDPQFFDVAITGRADFGTGLHGHGEIGVHGTTTLGWGVLGEGPWGVEGRSEIGVGVHGVTRAQHGYGGQFENETTSGAALYARSGGDEGPDLVLGANSSSDDNGVIASEPSQSSSDIVLRTNDTVRIDLNADGSHEDADFEIWAGNERIFNVDDAGVVTVRGAGIIQSTAVSRIFVPGIEAVPHEASSDVLTLKYQGRGAVWVQSSSTGRYQIVIPIQIPAVLYGQPVRIADMRVHYNTTDQHSGIAQTYLYRQNIDGTYTTLISNVNFRNSTSFTYYHLNCTADACLLGHDASILAAVLTLEFDNTSHRIRIGGIRLTLEHD